MTDSTTLMALDLESRLTVANAITDGCACADYFVARREVLLPEVAKHAETVGADPVDVFAEYARGVHQRHLAGLSLAVTR